MSQFYCREDELQKLNKRYAGDKFECIVIYGRRTGQFKIEPLDYKETAVFHPNLSAEDNSLIYGITRGVLHYINKLDVKDGVDEALLDNFFDCSGYLYAEPGNLLKQELREPAIYNAIIKAIAEGAS